MASALLKGFLLLMSINILLFVGGVRVVGDDSSQLLSNFVDLDKLEAQGTVAVNDGLTNVLPQSVDEAGSNALDFVDQLRAVSRFINLIVNLTFTPLGLFIGIGLPTELVLIFGLPILVVIFFGVAFFIRGGSGS